MNIKKIVGLFLGCAMASAVLIGCGSNGGNNESSNNGPVKLGMLTNMNITEQVYASLLEEAGNMGGRMPENMRFAIKYYDNMNTMQLGLESGSIQEMSTYNCIAKYIQEKNSKYQLTDFTKLKMEDSFCCAVRDDDKELLSKINASIKSMKEDGTLDRLVKEYIENVTAGQNPPAVNIEKIHGRRNINVGITGDLPPIDLVLANGSPAGFNTAVLNEIGKRINMNINIVQIATGARASALSAKKVDVVFWTVVPADNTKIRPTDIDKPKGIATTIPYYKDEIVHITMAK